MVRQRKVLDMGWCRKEGAYDGAPLREQLGFAKTDGVVFQCVPENLQHIALGVLDAVVDLGASKAFGLDGDCAQALSMAF